MIPPNGNIGSDGTSKCQKHDRIRGVSYIADSSCLYREIVQKFGGGTLLLSMHGFCCRNTFTASGHSPRMALVSRCLGVALNQAFQNERDPYKSRVSRPRVTKLFRVLSLAP